MPNPDWLRWAALGATALLQGAAPAQPTIAYRLVATVPLGAPDRWDYVVADPATARVYVAHGDRVTVLDAASSGNRREQICEEA